MNASKGASSVDAEINPACYKRYGKRGYVIIPLNGPSAIGLGKRETRKAPKEQRLYGFSLVQQG